MAISRWNRTEIADGLHMRFEVATLREKNCSEVQQNLYQITWLTLLIKASLRWSSEEGQLQASHGSALAFKTSETLSRPGKLR